VRIASEIRHSALQEARALRANGDFILSAQALFLEDSALLLAFILRRSSSHVLIWLAGGSFHSPQRSVRIRGARLGPAYQLRMPRARLRLLQSWP